MGNWKDPEVIALWLWVGLFIVLLFVGAIVMLFRTYIRRIRREEEEKTRMAIRAQEELLENSILVQEKERKRIAADLHDNLVARLQVIRLTNNLEESKETLDEHIKESMQIARRISHDLSPPMLNQSKLSDLLAEYLEPLKIDFQIEITVREKKDINIENTVKLQVLRIFQELINNCIKHAKATKIQLQMRKNKKYFALKVADDGIGSKSLNASGMGIKNIESRSQLLAASYRFRSKTGEGTQFLIVVPLTDSN